MVQPAEGRMDAGTAVRDALRLVGAGLGMVVTKVCAGSYRLTEIEADERWPRGTGAVMLRTALDMLERHYRERKEG